MAVLNGIRPQSQSSGVVRCTYVKYHDDGSTKWVKFPDAANVKLMVVQSSVLEDFLSFQNVGKVGWDAIKCLGGADDFATYMLKVNRRTRRVKEVCQLVIVTVTVLHGTTLAFAKSQRVGEPGCVTQ
jgi:hypothetical protein